MDKENVIDVRVSVRGCEHYSATKEEGHPATCDNTERGRRVGVRGLHAKGKRPDGERRTLRGLAYMWNLNKKRKF